MDVGTTFLLEILLETNIWLSGCVFSILVWMVARLSLDATLLTFTLQTVHILVISLIGTVVKGFLFHVLIGLRAGL